jgi:4-amino-4-deoxy-L-arabinose transferase-like glycosyltransferase
LRTVKVDRLRSRLFFLLILVFVVRLLASLIIWQINGPIGFYSPDTASYAGPARSLLHGAFLSAGDFSPPGTPEIFRTPGYPILLMPAVASGWFTPIAVLENILFSVISAWLIWNIVSALSPNSNAGFWAMLLYCFEPVGFLHSVKILSEAAFTTFLLLSIWLLLRYLRNPAYITLLLAALTMACAIYIRPVPLYLGVWLAPVLLLLPRQAGRKQRVIAAILFPVILAVTTVPWVIRNSRVADYWGFSSSSAWNLYFMSAAAIGGQLQHRGFSSVAAEMGNGSPEDYLKAHPEQRSWSEGEIARFWNREAMQSIKQHWLSYALIHARGCGMVVLNPGASEVLRDLKLYPPMASPLSEALDRGLFSGAVWLWKNYPATIILLPFMMALLLCYYILAVKGLGKLPLDVRVLLISIFVYFVLVSGFPAAVARYRVPVMPLVCICAGIGIARSTYHDTTIPQTETAIGIVPKHNV